MEYNNEYSFIIPYIFDDEYILWKGKPERGHYLTSSDIFVLPFSVFWSVMALHMIISSIGKVPVFVYFFFIPFAMAAFFLVCGRFLLVNYINKRTYYVITNKKLIRHRRNRIDILDGNNLPRMRIRVNKNGSGTIRFGYELYYTRNGRIQEGYMGNPWGIGSKLFSLDNIPNVAQVQQIIDSMDK